MNVSLKLAFMTLPCLFLMIHADLKTACESKKTAADCPKSFDTGCKWQAGQCQFACSNFNKGIVDEKTAKNACQNSGVCRWQEDGPESARVTMCLPK